MVQEGSKLKIKEARPIDRFKNQGKVLEKFGESGISVYECVVEGLSAAQISKRIGLPIERCIEILEFMEQSGMLEEAPGAQSGMRVAARAQSGEEEAAQAVPADMGEGQPAVRAQGGMIKPKMGQQPQSGEEESIAVPAGLSSLEKLIYEKYGQVGIKVYNLIDGEKTAEEILNETHISEVKLVEILEFMDEHGIIKLEKPEEKKQEQESGVVEKFKPILEEQADPAAALKAQKDALKPPAPAAKKEKPPSPPLDVEEMIDIIPIDVPQLAPLTIAQKAELAALLPIKFGKVGMEIFKHVDGKGDFVEIALALRCSLFEVDEILGYFGKKNFVTFSQLPRDDIRKKYGEDGFSIYKKYGRDGVFLYELIGKEKSLRDIILMSKIEPTRAVEIFMFIHRVLGLEVPFDKDMVYRQLGIK